MHLLRSAQATLRAPALITARLPSVSSHPKLTSIGQRRSAGTSIPPTNATSAHLGRTKKLIGNRHAYHGQLQRYPEALSDMQIAQMLPKKKPYTPIFPQTQPFDFDPEPMVLDDQPPSQQQQNPFSSRTRLSQHPATSFLHTNWPYLPEAKRVGILRQPAGAQMKWALESWSAVKDSLGQHDIAGALQKWNWLRDNIAPLDANVRQFPLFYEVFNHTRTKILQAKLDDAMNLKLPSLTEIYQMIVRVGSLQKSVDRLFKVALLQAEFVTGRLHETSVTDEQSTSRRLSEDVDWVMDAVVEDQEAFWKLIFTKPSPPGVEELAENFQGFQMPRPPFKAMAARGMNLEQAIRKIIPYFNPNASKSLPPALLAWYLIFSMQASKTKKWGAQFTVFRLLLDKLMFDFKVSMLDIRHVLKGYPNLCTSLPQVAAMQKNPEATVVTFQSQAEEIHRRVSVARERGQLTKSIYLLREFQGLCNSHSSFTAQERAVQSQTYNFFVYVFCCFDDHKQIDCVLQLMEIGGHHVNVTTYTAMINGWRLSRQLHRIQALWVMLQSKKIPVDEIFWVTRINAIANLAHVRQAVDALFEMERLYQADSTNNVAPTISCVNAVISALFKRHDVDGAHQILEWAAKRNLEPDLVTYNILLAGLKSCEREADMPEVLEAMRKQEISPDINTYTTLLEQALESATNGADTAENVKAVLTCFKTFEESDIGVKLATYAKMLHVVLANDVNGAAAAQAILEHLDIHGLRPSRYIFTILFEYYFARGALDTVKEMIVTWEMERFLVDPVFWDCVINGFASLGDIEATFTYEGKFLTKFPNTPLTMSTQASILQCLLRENRIEEAQSRVLAVAEKMKTDGRAIEERFWEHRFWAIAREHLGIDVAMSTRRDSLNVYH